MPAVRVAPAPIAESKQEPEATGEAVPAAAGVSGHGDVPQGGVGGVAANSSHGRARSHQRALSHREVEEQLGQSIVVDEYDADIGPAARRFSERGIAKGATGSDRNTDGGRSDSPVVRFTTSPFMRSIHRHMFAVVCAHMVVVPLICVRYPAQLPYLYLAELVLLVALRLVYYYHLHWHYFCLDFCYFGNLTVCAYLLVWPTSERLFMVCFAIAHGPLLFAVVAYRNSLVPHSLDKMTSCFIHVAPPIVMFTLRWHHVDGWSTCAHEELVTDLAQGPNAAPASLWTEDDVCGGLGMVLWLIAAPFAGFCAHQVLYYILVEVVPNKKLREDKSYLTSYRYMMSLRGLVYKLATCFGYRFRVAGYAGVCVAYAALSLLPVPLWWDFYWANVAMLGGSLLVMAYNGGAFYTDVFSRKYAAKHGLALSA